MDSDQKFALGVLLVLAGLLWLFFCVIWMPRMATGVVYLLIWLRAAIGPFPIGAFRFEFILPISTVCYGVYLVLRRNSNRLPPGK
jgi:hypothetical protein